MKKENNGYLIKGDKIEGVLNKETGLSVNLVGNKSPFIALGDDQVNLPRKDLAEFLWMAVYYIDSDMEFCPDKLPCLKKD